jgi:hypothetical protein
VNLRRDVRPVRNTLLDELRAKHQQRFDAVDGDNWGCICFDGPECMMIIVISALTKSEQELITALKDLKKLHESHQEEIN